MKHAILSKSGDRLKHIKDDVHGNPLILYRQMLCCLVNHTVDEDDCRDICVVLAPFKSDRNQKAYGPDPIPKRIVVPVGVDDFVCGLDNDTGEIVGQGVLNMPYGPVYSRVRLDPVGMAGLLEAHASGPIRRHTATVYGRDVELLVVPTVRLALEDAPRNTGHAWAGRGKALPPGSHRPAYGVLWRTGGMDTYQPTSTLTYRNLCPLKHRQGVEPEVLEVLEIELDNGTTIKLELK